MWNISKSSSVILAASILEISCGKKQTDRLANAAENPTPMTAVGMGKTSQQSCEVEMRRAVIGDSATSTNVADLYTAYTALLTVDTEPWLYACVYVEI